ncbi:MAG TPA: hypothetical protein VH988_24285 [Thermoanaerobaculia bacterium]|jgi:hypothetical protein|nr:hypothetical protein [Thermoanaerobaculia bacterium]
MKKKTSRKLMLSRETIGLLGSPDLKEALGAYGTMETQCCNTMDQCSVMSCGFTCPKLDQ